MCKAVMILITASLTHSEQLSRNTIHTSKQPILFEVCGLMGFSPLTIVNPSQQSNCRAFPSSKETLYLLAVPPTPISLQPLATGNTLFVSVDLPVLDKSYKRKRTPCAL